MFYRFIPLSAIISLALVTILPTYADSNTNTNRGNWQDSLRNKNKTIPEKLLPKEKYIVETEDWDFNKHTAEIALSPTIFETFFKVEKNKYLPDDATDALKAACAEKKFSLAPSQETIMVIIYPKPGKLSFGKRDESKTIEFHIIPDEAHGPSEGWIEGPMNHFFLSRSMDPV